ncbi:hypothetical protein TNCV_2411611 [Trichonephila clavipes]|nr:hypothetical protein TNCV_2411611 [Trichonephila clavipes]
MQHVDALSRHPVMLVTSDELTYKIMNAQESGEYIRTIKKLLQEGRNVPVNGDRYRVMITNFFIPELNNHDVQKLWFQQDGATCHTARATIDLLKDTFGNHLISRFGPVNWPPRSCDLTPLDSFLWGYVKSLVYADKPQTLDHLEDNIRRVIADIRPQMLEKVIENWTTCEPAVAVLCQKSYLKFKKKRGKGEGFLNPIPKENLHGEERFTQNVPLSTYQVDFIGPLPTTNKNYNHIFTVIDAFTKFTWLYPPKSTTAQEAIERLKLQQKTFGNPSRIINDKGGAFKSKEFEDYCADEQISNVQITTGVPRGNRQFERIHRVLIPVLTKMSIKDPTKWFKHVNSLQRVLNNFTTVQSIHHLNGSQELKCRILKMS